MKKIAVFTVVAALAGCASDTETTQLISSSSEEVYTADQLRTMEQMQEAKIKQAVIAVSEEAVKPVVIPEPAPKLAKQAVPVQPKPIAKAKPEPVKPAYKYAKVASEGYTIQVLALSHNKGFTPYINKLPSDQPVWMNKKELKGLPWYTLLFGHYDTREEAKRALNALPKDVKDYGPFIRSLDAIKASPTPKLTKLN